tara:strand:- start:4952 stop:5491 length:540 start_codon:yes stop_codon:yes gene_type:complete
MRAKWQREADNNVQIRIIPKSGKAYTVLGTITGSQVIVEKDEKRRRPGKVYPIDDIATYEANYPPNFPVSFMRTNIKEMLVYGWNWEPVSNRSDDPLMSPDSTYNVEHERFTSMFVMASQLMADYEERLQKALTRSVNPMVVYVLLGMACVGVGYLILMLQPVLPDLQGLDELKKGFGL